MTMTDTPRGTTMKVTCPRDGDVLVSSSRVIIDNDDDVYRFPCPKCQLPVDKPLTDDIRGILRKVGVVTVDELCGVFASLLQHDGNIWRGMLT